MRIDNVNLELEAYLEILALKFLNIVGEEGKYDESLSLANELIDHISKNKNDIFNRIPATGNFGIALHTILANNLINDLAKKVIVRLVSYWTISNHINQESIPLLRFNRATGLYSDRKLFYEMYKKTITSNIYSIDYQVEISTFENTVNMLFMHDLYLIKNDSPYFNQVFNVFEKEFGIPPLGFYTKEYYHDSHKKLMDVIKSGFVKVD